MNKYLLGVLIGLGTIGTTYASIVSRGFLDEALTSYATTTALDLKANQSDLTNLSNIVGTPTEMTYKDMIDSNRITYGLFGGYESPYYTDTPIPTNDISEFILRSYTDENFPGVVGLFVRLFSVDDGSEGGWPIRLLEIFDDYQLLYEATKDWSFYSFLRYGGSLGEITVYGLAKLTEEVDKIPALTESVNANTAKIGTLPDGYETVGAALTAINAKVDNKIENLSETASAGKYVLTAVRVGDQTTYAWELIDRSESEATTTTTTE